MINVTIHRHELVAADACAPGLALYDAIAAMQGDPSCLTIPDWGPLHWAWAAACGHSALLAWCADRHLLPMANLRGADLHGANLRWANLHGANLREADLREANLHGADLRGAYRGTSPVPDGWRVDANGYLEKDR